MYVQICPWSFQEFWFKVHGPSQIHDLKTAKKMKTVVIIEHLIYRIFFRLLDLTVTTTVKVISSLSNFFKFPNVDFRNDENGK